MRQRPLHHQEKEPASVDNVRRLLEKSRGKGTGTNSNQDRRSYADSLLAMLDRPGALDTVVAQMRDCSFPILRRVGNRIQLNHNGTNGSVSNGSNGAKPQRRKRRVRPGRTPKKVRKEKVQEPDIRWADVSLAEQREVLAMHRAGTVTSVEETLVDAPAAAAEKPHTIPFLDNDDRLFDGEPRQLVSDHTPAPVPDNPEAAFERSSAAYY